MTSSASRTAREETPQPPSPHKSRWWWLLGFVVPALIGVAPHFGKAGVPAFTPLLKLIPDTIQTPVIPLSAALMGFINVLVKWYGRPDLTAEWFRRWFTATGI